jgi:hypothetical protein
VLKATPAVTWNNPADIVFGTPLSGTQLNATANVPGTFVYSPVSGTVLNAGNGQNLSVTFTPINLANYTQTTKSVSINVLKATPAVTWNNPADIVFGTPLSGTQLNATANVPGMFVYSPVSGTFLNKGKGQTLLVVFTPADQTDYKMAAASVTINVLNAPPSITSAPSAVPNPASAGQVVSFVVAAGDADGDALGFAWDFGDGTSGAGATATHAYNSPGLFTATVTVTDSAGLSVAGSVGVQITAASVPLGGGGALIDSNGNGIPDEMESAAASIGISSLAAPSELPNVKLLIKLNFAKAGGDSIVLSGAFASTSGLKLNQLPMVIDVGGVVATFVLNSKGKASSAGGSVAVSLGRNASTAPKFTAKLGKGSFATALSALGLVNADIKSKAVSVPVTVMFDGKLWAVSKTLQYKATKGKGGVAR